MLMPHFGERDEEAVPLTEWALHNWDTQSPERRVHNLQCGSQRGGGDGGAGVSGRISESWLVQFHPILVMWNFEQRLWE